MEPSAALPLYCRPGFMNPGVVGPDHLDVVIAPTDSLEAARPVARRVVDAYLRARREQHSAAPSLWDHAAAQHRWFLEALAAADVEKVARALANFFATDLVWGLAPLLRDDTPEQAYRGTVVRTADSLVSLGQAVGVLPVRSIEQGGPLHAQPIAVEAIDKVLEAVEQETGLNLSFLEVASNRGWRFGPRITNAVTLRHAYGVWRLRQLGFSPDDVLVEIGGGFGCMAALAVRAGYQHYTIFDLPWVNAIQGYVLIRTLGHDAVQLYGERTGGLVHVAPFWTMSELAARSVDAVVNVNSLPEIGDETARQYIRWIASTVRRAFISINQEAQALTIHGTHQLRVWQLVKAEPRLTLKARHISWMEQGYVEEIYYPCLE